jgi:hypothetical protein
MLPMLYAPVASEIVPRTATRTDGRHTGGVAPRWRWRRHLAAVQADARISRDFQAIAALNLTKSASSPFINYLSR